MEGSDARGGAASAAHATGTGATGARLWALSRSARLALLDDERLALLAARGSKRGFARLRERYQQPLYAYCYLLLRDADSAYEALQATLARALAEMQEGTRDELLRPWLFRIAHEQAHMLARGEACAATPRSAFEQVSALEDAPEERARLAQLAGDLSELPVVQRSALLMRELTGMRHAEIANALGISRAAVRQSIFLARRSLSEFQLGRSLACEEVCRTLSHGDGRKLRRRTLRAHLRDCGDCAAFARAIEARRADFRTLTPALAGPLAAGALARLAAGSKPPPSMLAGCTATKTAATTLAAKAAAATASAIALTAGVGAGVAIALAHAEGRLPGTASSTRRPPAVVAPSPSVSAARRRARPRVAHGPGEGPAVAQAGALPPPASPSLAPPTPDAGGAASSAADAASAPDRGVTARDAAPGLLGLPPQRNAGGGASAGSERRGRGNAPGERGHARGRGQDRGGGYGQQHRAEDPGAASARAHGRDAGSPDGVGTPAPSQAEGQRPLSPSAAPPAAPHGQERAAPAEEVKPENPPQLETPQLEEATGTVPLPAAPVGGAV